LWLSIEVDGAALPPEVTAAPSIRGRRRRNESVAPKPRNAAVLQVVGIYARAPVGESRSNSHLGVPVAALPLDR
jgi:hypothetical protein